jgi:hypothetical protein
MTAVVNFGAAGTSMFISEFCGALEIMGVFDRGNLFFDRGILFFDRCGKDACVFGK